MDIAKLRTKYQSLISEATALAPKDGGELSKEANEKINGLLGQADEIKAQIDIANRLADGEKFANEPGPTQAAHLGWRPSGPGEGEAEVDLKAWREFEIPVMTPFGPEKKSFRYHVPLKVQGKGYTSAFEAYVRKGRAEMGERDLKALSEGVDASGGYTVPEDWQAGVIKKQAAVAVMRQFARVISTSRDIARWVRVKYTTNNEYTSGVRLTWTGEIPAASTTARVTDQVFGQLDIPVHTAMASQLVSMDLIEDAAYDVLGISSELFGEAFALGEEDAFWNGSGAGQPRGLITDASDTTNWDAADVITNATAGVIDPDELIDLAYAIPAQYDRNSRWFFTKATEKAIRKLKDADSDYIWPVKALVGGLGPVSMELLGYPVSRAPLMPAISATATTYPIVFGDASGYIVVDRVGLSLKRDENLYAETNQVLLLAKKRVGGQLSEAYKFSLFKTAST